MTTHIKGGKIYGALLMTVFFENGFSENYFPNVDNRNFPLPYALMLAGLKDELILNVEVWDGHWRLRDSSQYSTDLKRGSGRKC